MNKIKSFFEKLLINKSYVLRSAIKYTCAIYAVFGFIGVFAPLDELIRNKVKGLFQGQESSNILMLILSIAIFIMIFILLCVAFSIFAMMKKRYIVFDVRDGYHVYVQYGDVFNPKEVLKPTQRRNIVIPVNRCFDTEIDDDLISSNTLHGTAMDKLYGNGLYDEKSLSETIQRNLNNVKSEKLEKTEKRKGNLLRYPPGTVAEIKASETCTYFFLGLSWFDKDLHAHTSEEDYVIALVKLLKFCNKRSQQFPVVMPLIGGGVSGTQKNENDILEFLIKFLKLNKELINSDIHIIIRESGKDTIGIANLSI